MIIQQTTSRASILRKVFAWMLSLILFLNFISRPSYGFDIIHAQLFADILDVGVYDLIVAKVVVDPNDVQQALPCLHPHMDHHTVIHYFTFTHCKVSAL